jgi:enoyl-CoA hydratase/carnithine racemase
MTQYETLLYEVKERILTVTLNRPDRLNAFTQTMARELILALHRADEDDNIGAIIVTGAGRAFCAGMELSGDGNVFGLDETQSPTLEDLHSRFSDPSIVRGVRDLGGQLTLAIFNCNKPIIAAVNGAAVGIGATMTLAMDVRLAAESAKFGFVFAKLGIVSEACSSWFLPRIVGISQALEWMYSAEMINPTAAKHARLIKEVFSPERLIAAARDLAHTFIDDKSPVATMLMRHMLYRNSAQADPIEAHRIESLGMFYTSRADGKEGVDAFLQKRKPAFNSRASDPPKFFPWW